ncbi:MAG: hypothetical protein SGJ13_07025 [Actinomycetota bacterium]|nr:hypothetical protein [Actinomycetota bacterium]
MRPSALRRLLPLALLLLFVAALAIVLSARQQLEAADDEVQTRWDDLLPVLDARYDLLAALTATISTTSGPTAELAGDVDDALDQWDRRRADDASVAELVASANRLEGLARRLGVTVRASEQLAANAEVMAALAAYEASSSPDALPAFLAADRDYAAERAGAIRSLVADVLGYDPIPTLVL